MANDYIVKGIIQIGQSGSPQTVAGITSISISETHGFNDVRDADTGSFAAKTDGQDEWTATIEYNLKHDGSEGGMESSQAALLDAARAKDELTLVVDTGGRMEDAPCVITSSEREFSNDKSGNATGSFEVAGTGPWSAVAS